MIRTKGEPGTGDVIQAVTHMRSMMRDIRRIQALAEDELYNEAKELEVPLDLLRYVHENGKLPVVNFAAGGVATPADAALMMQLGAEGVFVGSGIFKSGNPEKRARAIVQAVTNWHSKTQASKRNLHFNPIFFYFTIERALRDVQFLGSGLTAAVVFLQRLYNPLLLQVIK